MCNESESLRHGEGRIETGRNQLVIADQSEVDGKKITFWEIFSDITENSFAQTVDHRGTGRNPEEGSHNQCNRNGQFKNAN